MKKFDLLIAGVGGQGVILASDIIGEVALAAGYDVKKTDTLGMAQRGGSVLSNVRLARRIWSPLIKEGEVDIMLAFEKLEAARWSHYLKPGAVVILNNHTLPPLSVNLGNEKYPADEEIAGILRQRSERIYFVNGTRQVSELGKIRTLNMYMLGCVSLFLPLNVSLWKDGISQCIPSLIRQINIAAFDRGRKEIRDVHFQ
ncbi:indolepyruvate oxidoreductase subunit beta [Chloroflexota bacterium]